MLYHIPMSKMRRGALLVADDGFDCIPEGRVVRVKEDIILSTYEEPQGGFYVVCRAADEDYNHKHYLAGQLGTPAGDYQDDIYVGFRFATLKERLRYWIFCE